ncbi:MAG: 30S ribosomal protein S21 [Rickettsiaceae bacterium]
MAVSVVVHPRNKNAIRDLKRKMQRELIFRKIKSSRFYTPPSLKRALHKKEVDRRKRRVARIQRRENKLY